MNQNTPTEQDHEAAARHFVDTFHATAAAVRGFIVGQGETVEQVLIAIAAGGHVLLEGVPGLGKTALVTSLARAVNLDFGRIQFTPDLLPSDIVGSMLLAEREGPRGKERSFEFQRGPVFTNLLLADEINRATPKSQSALLETMQEKAVTVAGVTHKLDAPFFVLATQNPVESDGTYPLPEAQLDRFFFKLHLPLPTEDELVAILDRTGGVSPPAIEAVASGTDFLAMGETLRRVPIDGQVQRHLVRLVRRTHPSDPDAPAVREEVRPPRRQPARGPGHPRRRPGEGPARRPLPRRPRRRPRRRRPRHPPPPHPRLRGRSRRHLRRRPGFRCHRDVVLICRAIASLIRGGRGGTEARRHGGGRGRSRKTAWRAAPCGVPTADDKRERLSDTNAKAGCSPNSADADPSSFSLCSVPPCLRVLRGQAQRCPARQPLRP